MIPVVRGNEPPTLSPMRTTQLAALRALGRSPNSKDIDGYRVVANELWKAQHYKCCYCEQKIMKCFNDVEHYRPKGSADRLPGSAERHGYWWLAFTWDNLLFACPACNRSGKNDQFPLNHGSIALQAENSVPGNESPLLIDPGAAINPVEHIEFVLEAVGPIGSPQYWWALPRNGSMLGDMTIIVCKLNSLDLLELRNDHFVTTIFPQINALNASLVRGQREAILIELDRALLMLSAKNPYVAFTYDAMRTSIPDSRLQTAVQRSWPVPSQVGR